MKIKVAVIQINACAAIAPNLLTIKLLARKAVDEGACLLVLPENFGFIGAKDEDVFLIQEPYGCDGADHRLQHFVSEMARRHKIWIVGGTIPLRCKDETKVRSACMVWNTEGEVVARYDKMHLFDVFLAGNGEHYQESKIYEPGSKIVVIPTPFGKLGLAVCYDLRFSDLFHAMRMQGAEIIALPSAFTAATGRAHWQILLQARAIESQVYLLAANQVGTHANNRVTYGHSMIVGPWGNILAQQQGGVGFAVAEIDLLRLQVLREDFPVWSHRRLS